MIKYNNSNINDWNFGSDNIAKVYYGVTSGSTSRLPQGYTEVEYIRNSNYNAYINTDVLPFDNNTNSYTITVKITSEFHSNLGCATIISSEVPSSPYNGLGYRYKCSSAVDQLEFFGGNANYSSSTVVNGDGTNTITFQSTGNTSWTSSIPLTFCCSFSDTAHTIPNRFADVTIYSATIVKNGSTVRDFVPCKRDSDSVYGLYDLINDVFYSSPNGNNFSGGSAVTPSSSTTVGNVVYQKVINGSTPPTPPLPYDAEIEYLQSSGTQYINTSAYLYTSNFEIGYNILGNQLKWGYTHQGNGSGTWILVEPSTAFFGSYDSGKISISTNPTENAIKYESTNGITVNGNFYSKTFSIGNDSISSIPLYIFAQYDFRNGMDYGSTKLKSFYLKNNGELVLDMIPVRVGQVGYMYDKVSGQLFGNSGTRNFILGNDK